MIKLYRLSAVLLVALASCIVACAQVSGNVFKDFNFNGIKNTGSFPFEVGVYGVEVGAYDRFNQQLGTIKLSDVNGNYSFSAAEVPVGTQARIEFKPIRGSFDSKASLVVGAGRNSTNVQFVTAPATNIDFAISSQGWYSNGSNPFVALNAASNGSPNTAGTSSANNPNIYIFPWTLRNAANTGPATVAGGEIRTVSNFQLGSVYGMAYQKTSSTLLMAAYLKRHIGFGQHGISAIYKATVNQSTGVPSATSLLLRLVDLDINVGTDPRLGNGATLPTDGSIRHADPNVWSEVGKRGIGGIATSDDGRDLWVVNMFEKKLHRISIGNPLKTSFSPADVIGSYIIPPAAGAGVAPNWRPMACKFIDDKVYVGGVQVHERTTPHNLQTDTVGTLGVVYEFDPITTVFTEILRYPLSYRKGWVNGDPRWPTRNNWWCAWQNNGNVGTGPYDQNATLPYLAGYNSEAGAYNGGWYYPQPMLADIEFDVDDAMIIGIRDRAGDQSGYNQPGNDNNPPAPAGFGTAANPVFLRGLTGGEVLRAGRNADRRTYTMESRGQIVHDGVTYGVQDKRTIVQNGTTNWGNNAGTPVQSRPWIAGFVGPGWGGVSGVNNNGPEQGTHGGYFYSNQNLVSTDYAGTAIPNLNGGTGAIDAHANKANGGIAILQGSNEMMVTLMDPVTTSFAQGVMKFNNTLPHLAAAQRAAREGSMVQRLQFTATATGSPGNPLNGGKANTLGDIELIRPYQPLEIGNRVWFDANANSIQDADETAAAVPAGTPIDLRSPGLNGTYNDADDEVWSTTIDAQGRYYFSSLTGAAGDDDRKPTDWVGLAPNSILTGFDYRIEMDMPAGWRLSRPANANNRFRTIDNDARLVGTRAVININTTETEHDFDIGFNDLSSLGDRVWNDFDRDGIQDAGEPGVAEITVGLFLNGADGAPNTNDDIPIASTVTDAFGVYLFDNLKPSVVGDATTFYNIRFTQPTNRTFTIQTNTRAANGLPNAPGGGATNDDGGDVNPNNGVTESIYLAPAFDNQSIDAGFVVNLPPSLSSIGDKVWFDANADGIQNANEIGIAGVTLTLQNTAGDIVSITSTDAFGAYVFYNVPANTDYKIFISPAPGTTITTFTATTLANNSVNSDFNPATRLTAVFNSGPLGTIITGIDAGLINDNNPGLGDLIFNDLDRDGFRDADEPGIPGLTVNLYESATPATVPIFRSTTTDANGRYLFSGLTPGSYRIGVTPPTNYSVTLPNVGTNDRLDSDVDDAAIVVPGSNFTGSTHVSALYILPNPVTTLRLDLTADIGLYNNSTTLNEIGDFVWDDKNNNGIQDGGSETGLNNVTVRLLDNMNNPVNNPANGRPYVVVTTDLDGRYRFADIPAGTYRLAFANLPPDYSFSPKDAGGNDNLDSDANAPVASGQPGITDNFLVIGPSQIVNTIDAGINKLIPVTQGSIGNRVWFDTDLDGLQDANELGVSGVLVHLYRDDNTNGNFADDNGGLPILSRFTDVFGEFQFGGLAAGRYLLAYERFPTNNSITTKNIGGDDNIDSDANAFNQAQSGLPAIAGLCYIDPFVLGQGEYNLSIDVGVVQAANTNRLNGRVWWDNGQSGGVANNGIQDGVEPGIPGAEAVLYISNTTQYDRDPATPGIQPYQTTTDLNGRYSFFNLPDGNYKVLFRNLPAGFAFVASNQTPESFGSDSDPDFLTGLTLVESYTLNSSNRLKQNVDAGIFGNISAIGNRVWLDSDGDGLQDAGESSAPGVTVILYRSDGNSIISSGVTNVNGEYYFLNLTPGEYVLGFSNVPNNIPFTFGVNPGDNQINNNSDVTPATGRTDIFNLVLGEFDVSIDAGINPIAPASIGDFVWIDVNRDGVQQATEQGVPGIIVTLINGAGQPVGSAITGGRGSYRIGNIAPGNDYQVVFSNLPQGLGFTQRTDNVTATDATLGSDPDPITGQTSNFNLAQGQYLPHIDAGLILPVTIGDRVWRDDNRNGIQDPNEPGMADITVSLFANGTDGLPNTVDDNFIASTVTDAYGRYRFLRLPPSINNAGIYTLMFTLPPNYQFSPQTNTQTVQYDGLGNAISSTTNVSGGATTENGSDVIRNATNYGRTGEFFILSGEQQTAIDCGMVFGSEIVFPIINSISGKVFFDNNANGNRETNDQGVGGVPVELLRLRFFPTFEYVPYRATVSDGLGEYVFNDIPEGDYRIKVSRKPGSEFTPNNGSGTTYPGSSINSDIDNTGTTNFITVITPRVITDIDAGLINTNRSLCVIGDRVWRDLDRDGIQSAGEPGIAGVRVQLIATDRTTVLQSTVSDAYGYYSFSNLQPTDTAGGIPINSTNGYYVRFDFSSPALVGATVTTPNIFANELRDDLDSDALLNTGFTAGYLLSPGEKNLSVDAGFFSTQPIANIATLGDNVFNDLNGDGLKQPNEPGVPGITVELYNTANVLQKTISTDRDGFYTFVGLIPGDYYVRFRHLPPDFVFTVADQGVDDNIDSDVNPTTGRTPNVTVVGGINISSLDAGIRRFQASGFGTIGNKVWNDINGNGVQDGDELGVQNVGVTLYRDANGNGILQGLELTNPIAVTTTNAYGKYFFGGLSAGCYQVSFSRLPSILGFTLSQKDAADSDDTNNSDGNDINTTVAGNPGMIATSHTDLFCIKTGEENANIDLGLMPPVNTNILGDLVWIDSDENGLQDVGEPGMPGVVVVLVNDLGQTLRSTTSNEYGKFQFVGLPDGQYGFVFGNYPAGSVPGQIDAGNDQLDSDAEPLSGITNLVTLGPANRVDNSLDLGLTNNNAVLGNIVWNDFNDDGLQNNNEPGFIGVTTTLFRPGFGPDGIAGTADDAFPVGSCISNESGFYGYFNTLPGNYTLSYSTLPVNGIFTRNINPGDNGVDDNNDAVPATVLSSTASTGLINLSTRETELTIDAGITNNKRTRLGSYIWLDLDADGLQGDLEYGLPATRVSVVNAAGDTLATTYSDGFGKWYLDRIPTGNSYRIAYEPLILPSLFTRPIQPAGYTLLNMGLNGTLPLDNINESNRDNDIVAVAPSSPLGLSATFNLLPGDEFRRIDAGIVNIFQDYVLPINDIYFNAKPLGKNVQLDWTMLNEANVVSYELEHSIDGRSFANVGKVNSSYQSRYQFIHYKANNGLNHYRIKVIKADGSSVYSLVRRVFFSGNIQDIKTYPTPASNLLYVSIPSEFVRQQANISVYDMLGKLLLQKRNVVLQTTEELSLRELPSGKYFLTITTNGKEITKPFEVIR